MNVNGQWDRFRNAWCVCPSIGLTLDVSRMGVDPSNPGPVAPALDQAFDAMSALERGAIANADEERMVGHYWLRDPERAPTPEIGEDIESTISRIKQFAADVHSGTIDPPTGDGFYVTLLIGIGGSSLGPAFVCDALSTDEDSMLLRVIDNTDPDGVDRVLADIGGLLGQTLCIVVSKSGGTKETRNAMIEVAAAYQRAGLEFARYAVAVTQTDSALDQQATAQQWLARFPIWDWVGGRTSVTSAVGLLPAALQGIDIDAFLTGAREADACTRERDVRRNPAAQLALAWHGAMSDRRRAMVVLPYRDRLELLGKYLQQLVMESLGKRLDRSGQVVSEGLTVFGNKGTSDQHSYVQQLMEGPDDFFATFLEVLRDRGDHLRDAVSVDEGITSGDYLSAFLHGTRDALDRAGRRSMKIALDRLSAHRLGALIAVFERAVGLYAELINVNAYNQPGVEAGKKAADDLIKLQREVLAFLKERAKGNASVEGCTAEEIAEGINKPDRVEAIYHILMHLAANPHRGVKCLDESCDPSSRFASNHQ